VLGCGINGLVSPVCFNYDNFIGKEVFKKKIPASRGYNIRHPIIRG
jgi:hypothetical protein